MSKLALITGITGQDGSYLSEFLLEKNYKVYGIVRRNSAVFNYKRLDHIKDSLYLKYGDLSDSSSILNIINEIIFTNPDYEVLEIYNLAAQSHVQVSFEVPEYTGIVDGIGTLKILEIIKNLMDNSKIKFYQAGTSEMFGKVLECPQNENTPFNPQSPYASAKLYSHYIVKNYRESYKLFACNGILFNHESERRGDNFVTQKIINFIKHRKKGSVLLLGNLYAKRDWGHAKDYIKAMWLMLQHKEPVDYVVGMGYAYTIKEFINKSFNKVGVNIEWEGEGLDEVGIDSATKEILIKIDSKFIRPNEVDALLSDSAKIRTELGWKPEYDNLDKLIESML
tara:strand:+ start:8511 stop:9524 length:1014 start_codon:yes stop_codon:yes gene_type:complete